MIPRETIDEIFQSTQVEEVIADFVSLKKKGANYWACCPFHNEKTPSFSVSPSKGIYKCFGCGEGGNSVDFVMNHEGMTYPEALRYLAQKYNIEIPEKEESAEEREHRTHRESLQIVNDYALDFFRNQLHQTEEGKKIGLTYFQSRGFSEETIEKFKLGFAPDGWDTLVQDAQKNGYKLSLLKEVGLVKEKNGSYYDAYRGRVIFPIFNLSGRVIAFGGRLLRNDESVKKLAKYINSPESEVYHKSKSLYGLYQSKKSIVKQEECLLVEGYTDVISFHQKGIENVVASSGTSLTKDQILSIRKYAPAVTILYDGDSAGIQASLRGIDLILEEGLNVQVVPFPEGEDPDSFARSHDPFEIKAFLEENKKDFIVYKTEMLYKDGGKDPIQKSKIIHNIVESIALIPDQITRTLYVQQCSSLLQIEEKVLLNVLNAERRKKFNKGRGKQRQEPAVDVSTTDYITQKNELLDETISSESQEKDFIRILLNYAKELLTIKDAEDKQVELPLGYFLVHEVSADEIEFHNPVFQQIYNDFATYYNKQEELHAEHFVSHDNEEIRKTSIDLVSEKYQLSDWESRNILVNREEQNLKRAAFEALYCLKLKKVEQMIQKAQKNIEKLEEEGQTEKIQKELESIIELSNLKKEFSLEIGRPI